MQPRIEIVEQPLSKGQRFRYKCEGKSAGSLLGVNSTQIQKTFPSIKIHNHRGRAAVVVSCVTKDVPYHPHPHNLVGQDCKNGVCTLNIKDCSGIIPMTNVGVQCCKKQDIEQHLKERANIRVDPFENIDNTKRDDIDLGVVRLCFQVFLPDNNNKFTIPITPVVSEPIVDKKCVQDMVICRTSITGGKCCGGDEMFILCEKVNKDDIQVRFYEETSDGVAWEDFGIFKPSDVHRQCAIVIKTPAYKAQNIRSSVQVLVQLCKPSDNKYGEPIQFQYFPTSMDSLIDSTQSNEMDFQSFFEDDIIFSPNSQIVTAAPIDISEHLNIVSNDAGTCDQNLTTNDQIIYLINLEGNNNFIIQHGIASENAVASTCTDLPKALDDNNQVYSSDNSSRKRFPDSDEKQYKKQKMSNVTK